MPCMSIASNHAPDASTTCVSFLHAENLYAYVIQLRHMINLLCIWLNWTALHSAGRTISKAMQARLYAKEIWFLRWMLRVSRVTRVPAKRCSGVVIEYRTRNREVAGSTHTRSTASNLEQVANLLCAQINSVSYPQRDGKWVIATATGWRPMADWGDGVSASCTVGPIVR